jgi:hypothetical protein
MGVVFVTQNPDGSQPLARVFLDPIVRDNRRSRLSGVCLARRSLSTTQFPHCASAVQCIRAGPSIKLRGASGVVHLSRFHFHVVGSCGACCRHWSSWPSFWLLFHKRGSFPIVKSTLWV